MENKFEQMASKSQSRHQLKELNNKRKQKGLKNIK